jgi:hypothetical protein
MQGLRVALLVYRALPIDVAKAIGCGFAIGRHVEPSQQ